jgi:hypothetical protein
MTAINQQLKSIFIHVAKCGGCSIGSYDWNRGSGHATYADLQESKQIDDISKYYVWSFVRNPWARALSSYEDCPELHEFVPNFHTYIDILYKHRHIFKNKKYIRWSGLQIPEIPIGRIHFWPAHLCLQNEQGHVSVDFIGKLENINQDMKHVCKILEVNYTKPLHINQRKGKRNRKNTHYKDIYDDTLINKVGEIYGKDVEMFNYTYE